MDEATLTALIQEELDGARPNPIAPRQRIIDHLETAGVYSSGAARYYTSFAGFRIFEPRHAAGRAVEVARKRASAGEGARWIIKILSATTARVRLIVEIGGIEVTGRPLRFGDITLTSGDHLPRTEVSQRMTASARTESVYDTGVAYAWCEIDRTDIWAVKRPAQDKRPDPFLPLRTLTARLAAIREASPILLRLWSEHIDPDLDELFGTRGWGQPSQDAAGPWYSEEITSEDISTLERLYRLTGPHAKVVDIALRRVNLGRRRISPGDAALDVGIALEALMGDPSSNTDMTYKLRLRTALFLAETLDARRALSEDVSDLYKLRSKVAHGGEPKGDAYSVARRGAEIAREVLHKLIDQPAIPNWAEWELWGGDPAKVVPAEPLAESV